MDSRKRLTKGREEKEYTKLGTSDLTVSCICLGCMGFGDAQNGRHSRTIDRVHFEEIIKKGLELGIYFFDTAIAYQSGTSEQYVGLAMRDFAKREDVAVATKFCRARRRKYSRASPANSILNG